MTSPTPHESATAAPAADPAGRRLLAALSSATSAPAAALLIAATVTVAAAGWLRAYQVAGAEGYLVAAALAPVLIAFVLGGSLRQPPAVSYGASALALAGLLLILGGGDPAEAWRGLTNDPTRLLTETLPLAGRPELLVGPAVLTWISGAVTAEVWVRARAHAAAAALPVALFVLAYAATSAAPGPEPADGAALLGLLALLAVIRRRQTEMARGVVDVSAGERSEEARTRVRAHTPAPRATSVGVAVAVAVAAVVGVAVPAVPGLRSHAAALARPTPTTSGLLVDPLDTIASLRNSRPQRPAQAQFSVATSVAVPGYFGVATLDDYDGGSWTFDDTFQPSGGRIPTAPARGSAALYGRSDQAVYQSFRLYPAYRLPYVPVLDRPSQVRGLAVDADAQTGMLLPAEPGTLPSTFSAVSVVPAATLDGIPSTARIGDLAGESNTLRVADTSIPAGTASDLATATRFLATLTGERPAPSVAFLKDVEHALASREHRVDPNAARGGGHGVSDSTGGTSLAQVINAIGVTRAATPEQFATFFAVVARYLGVPARVVTGFRVPTAGGKGGIVAAGNHVVTNRDAFTWAEIPVAGVGWVVADPTPATAVAAPPLPKEQAHAVPPAAQPPHRANAVPEKQMNGGHAIAKPVHIKIPHATHRSLLPTVLLGVAALLLVALVAGPGLATLRRLVRRAARRSGSPRAQTIGAWLDLLDGLTRYGMSIPDGATTAEVAASAGAHFGMTVVAPIEELGALADRALFSTTGPADAPSAEAWRLAAEVRHGVAATLDRRQRARALLAVGDAPRRPVGARG